MIKKRVLAAALAFAVIVGTVAVSAPDTAYAADATLKTVSMFGGADPTTPYYDGLVASFKVETGYDVQDDSDTAENEAWKAGIIADFNTGNEPDVLFFFNGVDAKPLLRKVVDVATIRKSYPDYAKDVNASALNTMKEADGNTYAVPVRGFWEALYCNKDMFDEYGLDLPTDWDKMEKAIKTFRAAGIDPFTISFADEPHYMIETLIMSAGGVKDHAKNPKTNNQIPESWVNGLNMFKTLSDLGAFPVDAATKRTHTAANDFYTKKAAMFMDGSWRAGGVVAAGRGNDVEVIAFPTIPGGKSNGDEVIAGFSSGFYITRKAWKDPVKREMAVEFVNYMTSKESIAELMKGSGGAGAPAASVASMKNIPLVVKTGATVAGKASGSDMPVDSRLSKAAWAGIWTKVGDIASGKTTAENVLKKAIAQNR